MKYQNILHVISILLVIFFVNGCKRSEEIEVKKEESPKVDIKKEYSFLLGKWTKCVVSHEGENFTLLESENAQLVPEVVIEISFDEKYPESIFIKTIVFNRTSPDYKYNFVRSNIFLSDTAKTYDSSINDTNLDIGLIEYLDYDIVKIYNKKLISFGITSIGIPNDEGLGSIDLYTKDGYIPPMELIKTLPIQARPYSMFKGEMGEQ
jgi:hypothetical protein